MKDLGTESQQWIYDNGLLKPKNQPTPNHWHTDAGYEYCLGVRTKQLTNTCTNAADYSDRSQPQTYPLELLHCPRNEIIARHMRFIMVDGRVQSLAPVVVPEQQGYYQYGITYSTDDGLPLSRGAATPFCMQIDGTDPLLSAGTSKIVLAPCSPSSPSPSPSLQQELDWFGTFEPFLFSLQNEYGLEDVIELAYGHSTRWLTMEIYNPLDNLVYSSQTNAWQGIMRAEVSELLQSINDPDGTTNTMLGSYRVEMHVRHAPITLKTNFTISPQAHVVCTEMGGGNQYQTSMVGLWVSVVGLMLGVCVLVVVHYTCTKNLSMESDDEKTVVLEDDEKQLEDLEESTTSHVTTTQRSDDQLQL